MDRDICGKGKPDSRKAECNMFTNRTLDRLNAMLDAAIAGEFRESDYDESKLSQVESKWKHFLGASALSKENLEKEKENVKGLVSDISHQTKTPMANMKLYAALLKESLQAGEQTKERMQELRMAEEIEHQAEKLEFLIQSLTKMSRLESNIVEVKPQVQKVSGLINAAVKDIMPKAEAKQIELLVKCEEEFEACYDMKWTKEALVNVLDNAVKYSHQGGSVKISVMKYELYTAVFVKDEGIGISEEETPKIFGRFYRASEVQQEDGVGIGLYLAREILRKEDGYIMVKSKKGEGSEFILHLLSNEI